MGRTAFLIILFVQCMLRLFVLKRSALRPRPLIVIVRLFVSFLPFLLFRPDAYCAWYCGFVVVFEAAFWAIEVLVPGDSVPLARAFYLVGYAIALFILTEVIVRPGFARLGPIVLPAPFPDAALLVCTGFIYQIREANLVVQYFIGRYGIAPKEKRKRANPGVDEAEIRRGNIIGVLERLLIFLFVVTGNYPVIGLVLAAKGFARYRNLDDKDFAEYVLIGTLLSYAMSIGSGALCKFLLDNKFL